MEGTVVEEGGKLSTLQTFKKAVDDLALGIKKSTPQDAFEADKVNQSFDDFGIPKDDVYTPSSSKYTNLKAQISSRQPTKYE